MSISLTRRARALLLFLSASGYVAWFSGLGERTEAAGYENPYPQTAGAPHFARMRSVTTIITRDPFSGAPVQTASAVRQEPDGELPPDVTAAPQSGPPAPGDVAVPNIGDPQSTAVSMTLAVRATIVGRNPVAYVENGTIMDIVRVGDTLGEERVTNIDLRGLTFADGTRLDLPGSFAATPPPVRMVASLAQRIEEIRRLLTARTSQSAPAAVQPVLPAATASAAASFPTPGPLPTADARGIPVGTNPTPDANGPTPYPNPYPYAPAR